jgi:hypothetical protein
VLQLLHLFLERPRWEAAAMERSKQQYLSHYRSLSKSLERSTADRILQARSSEGTDGRPVLDGGMQSQAVPLLGIPVEDGGSQLPLC